ACAPFPAAGRTISPGSGARERLYSVFDLENLTANWGSRGIFTLNELGEFFRSSSPISGHLLSRGRIDQAFLDRIFIQGFGNSPRQRIELPLSIINVSHHPDDPFPVSAVHNAALFLLSNFRTSPAPLGLSRPTPSTPVVPQPQVQPESFDTSTLASALLSMETQISALTKSVTGGQCLRPESLQPVVSSSPTFSANYPSPQDDSLATPATSILFLDPPDEDDADERISILSSMLASKIAQKNARIKNSSPPTFIPTRPKLPVTEIPSVPAPTSIPCPL